jgi:hypothetical protein
LVVCAIAAFLVSSAAVLDVFGICLSQAYYLRIGFVDKDEYISFPWEDLVYVD